jgi:hypothetical protein
VPCGFRLELASRIRHCCGGGSGALTGSANGIQAPHPHS